MIADLYILPESFENNDHFSKEEIEHKINAFAADFTIFQQYPQENICHINTDVYDVCFYGGMSLTDLLFDLETAIAVLDRDALNSLYTVVVDTAKQTDASSSIIINELLPSHTPNQCYGVICFNDLEHIQPEYQVIYDKAGWFTFRRTFLGMYPVSAKFFMDECVKYFPDLVFHEKNWISVDKILKGNSKKIVYHLTALNDSFGKYKDNNKSRQDVLDEFSIGCKLDEGASLNGKGNRNKAQYFTFALDQNKGGTEEVYCEPHMKLCYSDAYPGDKSYAKDRRIYFHEGKPNIYGGKILVGHIGEHL